MESSIVTLLSMKKNRIMRLEDISKELDINDSERFMNAIKVLEEEAVKEALHEDDETTEEAK